MNLVILLKYPLCEAYWSYVNLNCQVFQPEDSNSKVLGNEGDTFHDDITDSITSILRKEIEGKVVISNQFHPALISLCPK